VEKRGRNRTINWWIHLNCEVRSIVGRRRADTVIHNYVPSTCSWYTSSEVYGLFHWLHFIGMARSNASGDVLTLYLFPLSVPTTSHKLVHPLNNIKEQWRPTHLRRHRGSDRAPQTHESSMGRLNRYYPSDLAARLLTEISQARDSPTTYPWLAICPAKRSTGPVTWYISLRKPASQS